MGERMNRIVLNDEERELLRQVVERCERDLEVEILHTDNSEFRKLLKDRLNVLRSLKMKVDAPPVALAA